MCPVHFATAAHPCRPAPRVVCGFKSRSACTRPRFKRALPCRTPVCAHRACIRRSLRSSTHPTRPPSRTARFPCAAMPAGSLPAAWRGAPRALCLGDRGTLAHLLCATPRSFLLHGPVRYVFVDNSVRAMLVRGRRAPSRSPSVRASIRSRVCVAAAPQLPAHFSALRSASAPSLLVSWSIASRSTAPAPLEAALLLVAACASEASPTRGSLVTCRVVTRDPFPWPGDAAPATCHVATTRLAAIACASQSALRHPPFARRSCSARASTALQPAASLRRATVVRGQQPHRALLQAPSAARQPQLWPACAPRLPSSQPQRAPTDALPPLACLRASQRARHLAVLVAAPPPPDALCICAQHRVHLLTLRAQSSRLSGEVL